MRLLNISIVAIATLSAGAILWIALGMPRTAAAQSTEPAIPLAGAANARASAGPFEEQPLAYPHGMPAPAAPSGASARPQDAIGWVRLLVALGVVLTLIFALKPLLRRVAGGTAAVRPSRAIQVLSSQAIAPRQTIMLIRVGKRLVLIGNSGGVMNPLCEITDPDEVAAMLGNLSAEKAGSASRSFTSLLGRANRAADVQEMNRPLEDEPEAAPEEEMVAAAPTATSRAVSRDELSGLIEKVRNLQQQFER